MYCSLGFVLSLVLIALQVKKAVSIKKVYIDIGKNITIKCPLNNSGDVMWEREGRIQNHHMSILPNGSIFLQGVDKSDSGVYSCLRQNSVLDLKGSVNLTVRSPPPPVIAWIKPSTILALILWKVNGTGGYNIQHFTAEYRPAFTNLSWITIAPTNIMPNSRQIEVYSLKPNTTYEFRMWATNQLGNSSVVHIFGTTRPDYTEAGTQQFDTRWWTVAVGVVLGMLIVLTLGTFVLYYRDYRRCSNNVEDEPEIIELVPNIILNPGFDAPRHHQDITPDENSNNETPLRLNNNTVVQPQDL